MIEMTVSLALTGAIILISAFDRLRYFRKYWTLKRTLEDSFDVSDVDLSGRTEYGNCFSHKWVIENMTRTKHGRIGGWFQRQMMYSTLITVIWFGILIGSFGLVFGIFLISAYMLAGGALLIFFFGALIAVGPGGPKYSEELLLALAVLNQDEYQKGDYAFLRIALKSVTLWTVLSFIIGGTFLVSAPYGTLLFDTLGGAVLVFGDALLWGPMFILFDVWPPIGILYISLMTPFIFVIIPLTFYIIYRRMRYG
ncbi:MAG: hypothetical protein AM325_011585 [Candidatus Thorarchaeota archaeon SMTZ1-45]|nr:MAG: hypothetical protein AM325_13275 [Candidatus Thorarchaeota archaeon SMTZ1-45]